MERHRELDGAEAGREVATGALDHVDRVLAYLAAELQELVLREHANVARIVDALEHRTSCPYYGRVLDLSSHAAVITGATGNLGLAVVRAYLTRGTQSPPRSRCREGQGAPVRAG